MYEALEISADALSSRSFSYPGTFRDYARQALALIGFFGAVLLTVMLVVLVFDTVFLRGNHLTLQHFLILAVLFSGFVFITLLMARSLSRFRIEVDDKGVITHRGTCVTFCPYERIQGIERIRIPGWWPLRADLKPRRETEGEMVRINLSGRPPITFIGGLAGEDELIEMITQRAGLGDPK